MIYRVEVIGKEKVPKKGRLILCSNHISYIDPIIIDAYFPRYLFFMAKVEVFKNSFLAPVVKFFNAFPVNRQSFDRQTFRHSVEILDDEEVVGIFPEGTRSSDGIIRDGHKGLGLIAVMGNSPVLPMALSGTNKIIQKPKKRLFFPKVRLIYGDIIETKPIIEKYGNKQSINIIVKKTMETIKNLYNQINK
jgi:1-acyl-sn-glycerol-3-phosphate acyltransferase